MDRLENKIPPPALLLILGGIMWLVARAVSHPNLPLALRIGAGGALGVSGFALFATGVVTFRRAHTTVDPVHLTAASSIVTHGVFARTRNPMYVGFTAILVGWALYLASPAPLLGPVAFVLFTTRYQVLPEERALAAKFGEEYTSYCRRVPRWLWR